MRGVGRGVAGRRSTKNRPVASSSLTLTMISLGLPLSLSVTSSKPLGVTSRRTYIPGGSPVKRNAPSKFVVSSSTDWSGLINCTVTKRIPSSPTSSPFVSSRTFPEIVRRGSTMKSLSVESRGLSWPIVTKISIPVTVMKPLTVLWTMVYCPSGRSLKQYSPPCLVWVKSN